MGRIFCSITQDSLGWHETVCGNSRADLVAQRWGKRDYQQDRNAWHQNGHDAFLVELAKYGLGRADLAANVNWFSKVVSDAQGQLTLVDDHSQAGSSVTLRFEMDTLVMLHNCPHPLSRAAEYPACAVQIELFQARPVTEDDYCRNFRPENRRGFQNNALYHLGVQSTGDAACCPQAHSSQKPPWRAMSSLPAIIISACSRPARHCAFWICKATRPPIRCFSMPPIRANITAPWILSASRATST
jgi:hypothetical protein